jgi:thiamine-monophosphate kinase
VAHAPEDEFAIIAAHFAPLAAPGGRGLLDDAALLQGGAFVITVDAIVEGVHFLPDDPIDSVAQKALRVNLSDLAAKGARPLHYLLTLQWPRTRPAAQIAEFAAGLARDQATFGVTLLGGDTTATPGPLAISVTMIGAAASRTPGRADAQAGDDLWVTGVIGDGVLGLEARRRGEWAGDVVGHYLRPLPRTEFASAIAQHAHAAMDVSDGLLGDAAKIAAASGVRLVLDPAALPLSANAAAWLAAQPDPHAARAHLANGGDDYEILFTASPAARTALVTAAATLGLRLTRIGFAEAGEGVEAGGLAAHGYRHRLGA